MYKVLYMFYLYLCIHIYIYIYILYIAYIQRNIQKLIEDCYSPKAWRATKQRCCNNCVESRFCRGICGECKTEEAFTQFEWKKAGWPNSRQVRCKLCMRKNQTEKKCSRCQKHVNEKVITQIINGYSKKTTPVCATTASKAFNSRRSAAGAKKHLNKKVITQKSNGNKMRTPVCATTASKDQQINGHVITAKKESISRIFDVVAE